MIISESQPVEEPQVEENTLQEPEHETNAQIESIWHQIDDDDDDEPDHDQEHDDDNDTIKYIELREIINRNNRNNKVYLIIKIYTL